MARWENDTGLPNTFFDRVPRMFWQEGYQEPEYFGVLLVTVPLVVIVSLFFIIKKYQKKTGILRWYTLIALMSYIVYFFLISKLFYVV